MNIIAVISDIHGNLPALAAVLDDIRSRNISRIICLGDLAGKGPNGDKVVDIVRDCCEIVVQGNWDYMIASKNRMPFTWHNKQLGSERVNYLLGLPLYTGFMMSGKCVRLCHASPHDLFHRTFITTDPSERHQLFIKPDPESKDADVVGYGDIHSAYVDNFDDKTMFNTGSVGNPLEITQASYAILEGEYGLSASAPFLVTIARIPYNIDLAILHAEKSSMPDKEAYINELRTARYRGTT